MLVPFIAYADQFHRRGAALIDRWTDFRMLELHAERVADIALSEPETHLEGVHADEIENTRLEVPAGDNHSSTPATTKIVHGA